MKAQDKVKKMAAKLLSQDGDFTMIQLAKVSGVSRATLFRYFPSKAALLAEVEGTHGIKPHKEPATREKILEATRRFIAQRGFVSATIESIASEAGVNPVTVYRNFGDRETLIREALAAVGPTGALKDLLEENQPLDVVLPQVAQTLLRFFIEYSGILALVISPASEEHAEFERTVKQNYGLRQMLTRYFERQMKQGQLRPDDPEELTGTFFGMAVGTSIIMRDRAGVTKNRENKVEEQSKRLVHRFLSGTALTDVTKGDIYHAKK